MHQHKANANRLASPATRAADPGSEHAAPAEADGFQTTVLQNRIPAFAAKELERLYASIYSSLPQLEIEGGTAGVHSCVVHRGGDITDLWLFRIEGRAVCVLNETITIHAGAVRHFAATVFDAYASIDMLRFNAVYPLLDGLGLPLQRFHCSDDSVLSLPRSSDAYLAGLGKATRKNLKRYLSRLSEAFPAFRYDVYEREAIRDQHVHAIIALNRTRMAAKGKRSGIGDAQAQRLLALVKRCGMVGVASIDGRICAGAIVGRSGDNFFSFVRAHGPAYDDYRLGLIGAYHLVCACIARGGRELHFMWGREPHKALLGGETRELEHVIVFRSRLHALLHANLLVRNSVRSALRNVKRRLFDKVHDDEDLSARVLRRMLAAVRSLRRKRRAADHG